MNKQIFLFILRILLIIYQKLIKMKIFQKIILLSKKNIMLYLNKKIQTILNLKINKFKQ